jgi:hypothetical protein
MSPIQDSKQFFFEKKNQKTSTLKPVPVPHAVSQVIKFFCFFLFTKRSPTLPLTAA